MPQLLKLRFVSLGHPQARMDDLTLSFTGPDGRPTDSTLWLRNGGGKSSILNLFFAIVRPHKGEFLGGKADAKQRSLNDYVLAGDRAVAVAEWQLDPSSDAASADGERFVTGVFYERREGSGDLRRLYFSCRVGSEFPESTIENLPLYATANGRRTRRTLTAFREAWRLLRDRAPQLNAADTENQREWQEILESARIDPELFSYQVRMNQREGGADELFRFAEPEEFVDFLLGLALEPALGDRVGKNITAFRRELLQRKEQLIPERDLVVGLAELISVVRAIRERRERLRARLCDARDDIAGLGALAGVRLAELAQQVDKLEAAGAGHAAIAEEQTRQATTKRGCAAQLRRLGAQLRLGRLQDEHDQAQEEWRHAQRLARIWGAAVPLRRALQFEEKAKEQRRLLDQRMSEHAPLRAELEDAASRLASALIWRAQEHRKRAENARSAERAARNDARDYREQAIKAGMNQSSAESEAKALESRLAAGDSARERLERERLLGLNESPEAGAVRWAVGVQDYEDSVKQLEAETARLDETIEALDGAITAADEVHTEVRSQRQSLVDCFERAMRARESIECDLVIKAALELELVDADRISDDAVGTLEQAARATQHSVIEARLIAADDERAALHLEEHGLLPPSSGVQRLVEFLGKRLGGQVWSGWSWVQTNVPSTDARDAVRRAPWFAEGVVVRPADLERAAEIILDEGLEPDAPLVLADTSALSRSPELPGLIVGPKESAWFDREAAQVRLAELRGRLERHQERIQLLESQYRELTRSAEALRSFRAEYPLGWFANTAAEMRRREQREEEARATVMCLRTDRGGKVAERKRLEVDRRTCERDLGIARAALRRVNDFVEEHLRPAATWRANLLAARAEAQRSAEEVRQWREFADSADLQANCESTEAQKQGEEARVIEAQRSELQYIERDTVPMAGPIDEFRDRYNLLRSQYEQKVGVDALMALASQNDENSREERARLARLLSPDLTEDVVRDQLFTLVEPDTVDHVRQEAEVKASSLQGRMGNLKGRFEPAAQALREAEAACNALPSLQPLDRAPGTPELAEAEASILEIEAKAHQSDAIAEQERLEEARRSVLQLKQRAEEIERHTTRLRTLREDYADLLTAELGPPGSGLPGSLDESILPARLRKLSEGLGESRADWISMDAERAKATVAVRSFATGRDFERLNAPWVRRLQEHDDASLEDASEQLCAQLELRRNVLEEQIAGLDQHRQLLVEELVSVTDEGMKLLRQASSSSKLPDHLPGIGGSQFLRIMTHEFEDPNEKRARLAELIDDLLKGQHEVGGLALVQAAVRRVARPIQVRVLHPDPALDRRTVSIPEMARSSGGEQLTGAILLYCTLARVRGRSRGLSKRASSVLILDNPIGRASRVRFLELQREVARAMGIQLIYTTGVNDHEALRALPNIIRLRNERVDRNSGRRLIEKEEARVVEAVHLGRREGSPTAATENADR